MTTTFQTQTASFAFLAGSWVYIWRKLPTSIGLAISWFALFRISAFPTDSGKWKARTSRIMPPFLSRLKNELLAHCLLPSACRHSMRSFLQILKWVVCVRKTSIIRTTVFLTKSADLDFSFKNLNRRYIQKPQMAAKTYSNPPVQTCIKVGKQHLWGVGRCALCYDWRLLANVLRLNFLTRKFNTNASVLFFFSLFLCLMRTAVSLTNSAENVFDISGQASY